MTFKLEVNYLNIDNYPWVEEHLAKMANKGWMIEKIWAGSLFYYRRTEAQEVEFTILPYLMETALNRTRTKDLAEIKEASRQVGWTYLTKSGDLHLYSKPAGQASQDLLTDEEEEFRNLEVIGRKNLRGLYIFLPILLLLTIFNWGNSFRGVQGMKSGLGQLVSLMLPLAFFINLIQIIRLRKFLKKNQENLDLGRGLSFHQGANSLYTGLFLVVGLILLACLAYILYIALVLKNPVMRMALLPIFIGLVLGSFYRFFVKPSRVSRSWKKLLLVLTLILSMALGIHLGIFSISRLSRGETSIAVEKIRVLRWSSSQQVDVVEEVLLRDSSLLFPVSYDYSIHGSQGQLLTEYARGISQGPARRLLEAYLNQARTALIGHYGQEIDLFFEEGFYDQGLTEVGLSQAELASLTSLEADQAKKQAYQWLAEKNIRPAEDLWQVDQAYLLSPRKDEIVLRQGKEVFYLSGLDFTLAANIQEAKDQLGLD